MCFKKKKDKYEIMLTSSKYDYSVSFLDFIIVTGNMNIKIISKYVCTFPYILNFIINILFFTSLNFKLILKMCFENL